MGGIGIPSRDILYHKAEGLCIMKLVLNFDHAPHDEMGDFFLMNDIQD